MSNSHSLSALPTKYDGFLCAKVCDEASGMNLSVLSALTRMNIDPWQEATRLAAMPKAVAVETMKSMLCLVSGKTWHGSEATATAERLVNLLAPPEKTAAVCGAEAPEQLKSYWFLWVGLAVAFSLLTTHQQAALDASKTTSPTTIASSPNASSPNSLAPAAKPVAEPLSKPKDDVSSVPLSR